MKYDFQIIFNIPKIFILDESHYIQQVPIIMKHFSIISINYVTLLVFWISVQLNMQIPKSPWSSTTILSRYNFIKIPQHNNIIVYTYARDAFSQSPGLTFFKAGRYQEAIGYSGGHVQRQYRHQYQRVGVLKHRARWPVVRYKEHQYQQRYYPYDKTLQVPCTRVQPVIQAHEHHGFLQKKKKHLKIIILQVPMVNTKKIDKSSVVYMGKLVRNVQ